MQVTETLNEGLKREFKIVLTAGEVEDRIQTRLADLSKTAQLPGFRRGKVPTSLLRKRFGQSLFAEEVQNAVRDSIQSTIEEHQLRPAMEPKIDVQTLEPEKDVEFTMALEQLPEIEAPNLEDLKLERLTADVTDEAVDEALQRLGEQQQRTEPVSEERPAAEGDILVIDYVGTIEGEPFQGGSAEGASIELGASGLLPAFDEKLPGARVGEVVGVDVTFPEDYPAPEVAGKAAHFDVTVRELRAKVPVVIDEDFATSLGAENLEALRNTIREQLSREYRSMGRAKLKRGLLDILAERHQFEVPPGLVDLEFDQIWHQVEHARERGEIDDEDKDKTEEQLREEYRAIADRRVRLGLLLSDIGVKNNISVTDEEMTRAAINEARRYRGQEQEIFEQIQNNPRAQQALRGPIFEDKVVDYLIERAQVAEKTVSVDELARAAAGADEPQTAPAQPVGDD